MILMNRGKSLGLGGRFFKKNMPSKQLHTVAFSSGLWFGCFYKFPFQSTLFCLRKESNGK